VILNNDQFASNLENEILGLQIFVPDPGIEWEISLGIAVTKLRWLFLTLPVSIRTASSVDLFKRLLKTHLFQISFPSEADILRFSILDIIDIVVSISHVLSGILRIFYGTI